MLDLLLASALLFGLPGYAVLRSRLTGQVPVDKRRRYRKSIAIIAICLIILSVDWLSNSRSFTQLGLAAPTTHSAMAECLFAVLLLTVASLLLIAKSKVPNPAKLDDHSPDMPLPETADERRFFVIFATLAGFGWEVLYRGFLLFWLSPIVGLVPAVAASSIAYGLSHGCNTIAQTAGSLLSAFLFTTGYASTGSLWWLIILHTGLPLVIGFAVPRTERSSAHPVSGPATN